MNIAILWPKFYPEKGGEKVVQMAKAFMNRGHSVTAVAGFPSNPHWVIEDEVRPGLSPFLRYGEHEGIQWIRTFTFVPYAQTILQRGLSYLSFALSATLLTVFSRRKPDMLIIISPPFFTCVAGLTLRTVRGVPYVLNVQDIYPDTAIELGVLRNPLAIRFLRWFERRLYRNAAGVAVISEGLREKIMGQGISTERLAVLHNSADQDEFFPRPRDQELESELGLRHKTVVMYLGTVGLAQGAMNIVQAAAILKDHEDIHFLFVGSGVDWDRMKEAAKQSGLASTTTFHPAVSHEEVPRYLSLADICLLHLRRREVFKMTIPCKTYEYLAMGKPIIVAIEGEAKQLIERLGAGVGAEPENPEDLAEKILRLHKDRRLRQQMGESGASAFRNHFKRSEMMKQLVGFVEGVV